MVDVDTQIERILEALRRKMRERGFSQLQVQEELGWGRTYVSQLLTRQKNPRIDQVLMILDVIGIEPAQFFADTYGYNVISTIPDGLDPASLRPAWQLMFEKLPITPEKLNSFVEQLVRALIDNKLITKEELTAKLNKVETKA